MRADFAQKKMTMLSSPVLEEEDQEQLAAALKTLTREEALNTTKPAITTTTKIAVTDS